MNFYRVTDASLLDKIRENGIEKRGNWYGLGPAVYVTKKFSTACQYRDYVTVDHPAVVKIEIPDDFDVSLIVHDDGDEEHFGIEDSYRIETNIPAEWITRIYIYDSSLDDWRE